MNWLHRKQQQHLSITRNPIYSRAIQTLNDALEQNTEHPNVEKIRLLRIALFGDVEKLDQSGAVVIPK